MSEIWLFWVLGAWQKWLFCNNSNGFDGFDTKSEDSFFKFIFQNNIKNVWIKYFYRSHFQDISCSQSCDMGTAGLMHEILKAITIGEVDEVLASRDPGGRGTWSCSLGEGGMPVS